MSSLEICSFADRASIMQFYGCLAQACYSTYWNHNARQLRFSMLASFRWYGCKGLGTRALGARWSRDPGACAHTLNPRVVTCGVRSNLLLDPSHCSTVELYLRPCFRTNVINLLILQAARVQWLLFRHAKCCNGSYAWLYNTHGITRNIYFKDFCATTPECYKF